MRFGLTIVGAVVGAAIGVVIHLALELFGQIEAPWFAIITGLLTGLCVRKFDKSCAVHVSYVRGAIAGLIALCAIVGSNYLLILAIKQQAAIVTSKQATVAAEPAGEEVTSQVAVKPPVSDAPVKATRTATGVGTGSGAGAGDFSILQFSFIAMGVFIAYELSRGTGRSMTIEQQAANSKAPAKLSDESKET
jgi:hypothetical protein